MATIPEAIASAVEHHQAGRLQAAEQIYRQILAVDPNQPDAIHLLGVMAHQLGKPALAVEYIGRAITLKGTDGVFHNNLGNACLDLGRLDEAIACYRRALELAPDYANAHYNLGNALLAQRKPEEAIACFRRTLGLKPEFVDAHVKLGNAVLGRGKLDEAVACYRRALELRPDLAEIYYNLGYAFKAHGKLNEAVACYRRAVELKPDYAEALNNLGNALPALGNLDEAIACFRRALELKPKYAEAHNNLGNALLPEGELDEAIACYRRALELKPDYVEAYSNLVFAINFSPDYDARTIYEENCRWNRQFAAPLTGLIQPHGNQRSANRRLRIGYVSPALRNGATALFLLPLLEAHDHDRFEIFCYASVRAPDTITERCRDQADMWRDVLGVSDEQLAQIIRQDQIDILVDLTMHAANNRLLVFARKPAPVQVAYLAYPGTTGLRSIDYRLTDPYLDAPGQDETIYYEASIRLPETYWCYRPLVETPPVNSLPALQTGRITFGCLNNFCKITAPTLTTWIGLLQAVPESALLLHARTGKHRERVRELFARHGVLPERLEFADLLPMDEYYRLHHRIDVALDPFPYGGGTTTCDALWMGVPVVSLAGQTAVGRGGLSILSNVGCADLVAHNPEQYVRIATDLANDLPRLSKLRATLRERMQSSPLMDAPRFARNVEAAYRAMWRRWCES